jgi:hypothetical protein
MHWPRLEIRIMRASSSSEDEGQYLAAIAEGHVP